MKIIQNFKRFFNLERIVTFSAILALIVAIISLATCHKKPTFEDCEEIAVKYCDNIVIGVYDSLSTSFSHQIDHRPVGDTIYLPGQVIYRRTATFVKNAKELEELRIKTAELEKAYRKTLAQLDSVKSVGMDPLGQWFTTISEQQELPIIETTKRDSSDQFTFYARIKSRGQLEGYEHDIRVFPKIITITKREVETLVSKKKNFIAIKGGYIWYDSRNHAYPFTLQYGRSIFTIEAGPIVNSNFKSLDGWQAQGGFVIKFK